MAVLKNIKFKSVSARLLTIQPEPRILIKWCLEPTVQNLKNLFFFIDRSESENLLDFKQITGPIKYNALAEYLDFNAKLEDFDKFYNYQIRAVEYNLAGDTPLQTFASEQFTWAPDLDLTASYIIEEHLFLFKDVIGAPTLIYKKMTEGPRCTECWDSVLKRVTKSNCITCKGTGFIKGYYEPVEAWMDMNPDPKAVSISEWGIRQQGQTDILFTDYPSIMIDDVIVELENNRYWRVSNARETEKNRATILQMARLDEINRSDIELHIKVPENVRSRMLKYLFDRKKRVEF